MAAPAVPVSVVARVPVPMPVPVQVPVPVPMAASVFSDVHKHWHWRLGPGVCPAARQVVELVWHERPAAAAALQAAVAALAHDGSGTVAVTCTLPLVHSSAYVSPQRRNDDDDDDDDTEALLVEAGWRRLPTLPARTYGCLVPTAPDYAAAAPSPSTTWEAYVAVRPLPGHPQRERERDRRKVLTRPLP
jgi:hypothetical protein